MNRSESDSRLSTYSTVRAARGHLIESGQHESVETPVNLCGVLITPPKRRGQSPHLVGHVRELTGRFKILVSTNDPDLVAASEPLRARDRVKVKGIATLEAGDRLAVNVDRLEAVPAASIWETLEAGDPREPVPSYLVARFLLARLRHIASSIAEANGYREFEPSYISTLLPATHRDADPLSVLFQGWGGTVHLAISPAPQLLETLTRSGETRVFSVARCFSSAYRDGFSSAEKLALVARALDATLDEIVEFACALVSELLHDSGLVEQEPGKVIRWQMSEAAWTRPVALPTVQIDEQSELGEKRHLFRLILAPDIVAAEGELLEWSDDVFVSGLVVHLERLLILLQAGHRLSHIRNLGSASLERTGPGTRD